MAVVNGYTSLEAVKATRRIKVTDTSDDALLERLITQASRFIDQETGRTFYARSETRYYDAPDIRFIWLDDDLLTITSLTNGDGTVIPTSEYFTEPRNTAPKFRICLKAVSSTTWEADSNSSREGVIAVAGTWGYSASAPADIEEACIEIVINAYQNRYGPSRTPGEATSGGAGGAVAPNDVPNKAREIISGYRRMVLA